MQMAETVQWRHKAALEREKYTRSGGNVTANLGVRMGNNLPVLTEEGGESDLGRKVRQPGGRGCRHRKPGHCGGEVRQTVEKGLKDTCFGEIQKSAEHAPSYSTRLILIAGLPDGITPLLLRKKLGPSHDIKAVHSILTTP